MKVPRLHVGGFPILLLSLMALTSACVDGKCSSFLLQGCHFSAFPNFLRSCIATVHLTLKIRQLIIPILQVNSKIMKEKFNSFRYNGKKMRQQKIKSYTVEVFESNLFSEQLERSAPLRFVLLWEHECSCSKIISLISPRLGLFSFTFSFSKPPLPRTIMYRCFVAQVELGLNRK